MPQISYKHSHSLAEEEAKERVSLLLESFSRKYGFSAEWVRRDHAQVAGRGVHGTLDLHPGRVVFNLDLSFLLSPLKARIESAIAQEMERALS
jgi:putative polyhydroxyalkanoate system protein